MADKLEYSSAEKSYIERLIMDQKRLYQRQEAIMKHVRKMRTLQLETRTPRTFAKLVGQGVKAPMSYSLVQTVNGMMAKSPPHFTRDPKNPADVENAATLAATCWPLLQTYGRMMKKDLLYLLSDQLVGDGRSVTKLRRQRMDDYPDKLVTESDGDYNKRVESFWETPGRSPLRLSIIDPAVFKPDSAEEPTYVVETGKRNMGQTLKNLGYALGTNGGLVPVGPTVSFDMQPSGFSANSTVDEVWTDEFCYYRFDGEFLKFPNEFGFIPYSWRNGMTTSIPDPSYEAMSVAFPFYAMEPYINTLLTAGLSWAIMSGMPTAVVETVPGQGVLMGQETTQTDLPLGQMVTLQAGRKFSYAVPPPMGQSFESMVQMFLGFFDRAGITQAARGVTGTRMPGLTLTTAIEAAAAMFIPVERALAGMLEDIVVMTWKAQKALGIPRLDVTGEELIAATGRKTYSRYSITSNMVADYYDIHCDINPMSDQDLVQRGMHGAFMNQHGLWSTERAMLYGGVDNPIEERIELLKDMVRNTPLYQQQVLMQALAQDPEMKNAVDNAASQGQDLLGLGLVPTQQQPAPSGGVNSGALPGGQVRGMPAPSAGGRPQGMPRQPTGPQPGAYNQGAGH